jgi:hypothetical protein
VNADVVSRLYEITVVVYCFVIFVIALGLDKVLEPLNHIFLLEWSAKIAALIAASPAAAALKMVSELSGVLAREIVVNPLGLLLHSSQMMATKCSLGVFIHMNFLYFR